MPQSKRRKPRPQGGFVPPSQRKHGSLVQMAAHAGTAPAAPADTKLANATRVARSEGLELRSPSAPRPRHVGRNVAIGAAAVGAVGGAGYLVHRHNQRKHAMSKNLINPFEEVVVFGKAYPVALPVPGAQRVRALVPTGGHVGHANDLKVVRRSGSGGRATKLEIYRHSPKGLRQGPFGKAFAMPGALSGFGRAGRKAKQAESTSAGVQRGLALVNNPKVGNVSRVAPQRFSAPTPKINSNIPDGARRGNKLS